MSALFCLLVASPDMPSFSTRTALQTFTTDKFDTLFFPMLPRVSRKQSGEPNLRSRNGFKVQLELI